MKISNNTFKGSLELAFLLFPLLQSIHIFAQNDETAEKNKEAHYGLKAGINFAELWGDDALPESDRKVGYSFGMYAAYKISKEWKIQPEAIWSLQGENSKKIGALDLGMFKD